VQRAEALTQYNSSLGQLASSKAHAKSIIGLFRTAMCMQQEMCAAFNMECTMHGPLWIELKLGVQQSGWVAKQLAHTYMSANKSKLQLLPADCCTFKDKERLRMFASYILQVHMLLKLGMQIIRGIHVTLWNQVLPLNVAIYNAE
jgi:hypothetical protein